MIALIDASLLLATSRAAVAFDFWRAKSWLDTTLARELEDNRGRFGEYPRTVNLRRRDDAPWLVRRSQCWPEGDRYQFELVDPGVCGYVSTYHSEQKQWIDTYDPFWF